jgi:hypothetical protein
MANDKLNIAKTIRVGFNKRSGTYTGLLAYVIYYDEKNVLRKEKSWNSWIDKSIEAQEYPNEPTSGFVLNKKVGDYRSDWNHRSAAIRVYDPRGFEFEISVENLLYILQECTSTKGKGLEGEFVYAWDSSNLILLPTSSVEYQTSRVFTDHKLSKVSKKEMIPGCVYLNKDMENVLYLGREDYYEFERKYDVPGTRHVMQVNKGKKHIFIHIDNKDKSRYWIQSGFTKIASKLSDAIATNFAEEYEKFKQSFNGSPVTKITFEEHPVELENRYGATEIKGGYGSVFCSNGKYYGLDTTRTYDDTLAISCNLEYIIVENQLLVKQHSYSNYYYDRDSRFKKIKLHELKLYTPTAHNEYGKTHKMT